MLSCLIFPTGSLFYLILFNDSDLNNCAEYKKFILYFFPVIYVHISISIVVSPVVSAFNK